MRLPVEPESIEAYADFVTGELAGLERYVLVGDSFGAIVALALATRRPAGLEGLVLSGGFAADPVDSVLLRMKVQAGRFLPGPLYRQLTLRFHAAALASPFDGEGDVPWDKAASRRLFLENTPWRAYANRAKAAFSADYVSRLGRIAVPTLILTPEHDTLIGPEAATIMREGIPDAREEVLPRTGHMFRFSHPARYAQAVRQFLEARVDGARELPRVVNG
jgi:pimeloyl-ACP methyl ester carboxylesterase